MRESDSLPSLNVAQKEFIDLLIEDAIDALNDLFGEERKDLAILDLSFATSPETTQEMFEERMSEICPNLPEIIASDSIDEGEWKEEAKARYASESAKVILTRLHNMTHSEITSFRELRLDQMGDLSSLKDAIPKTIKDSLTPTKMEWLLQFGNDSVHDGLPSHQRILLRDFQELKTALEVTWQKEASEFVVDRVRGYLNKNLELVSTAVGKARSAGSHHKASVSDDHYRQLVQSNHSDDDQSKLLSQSRL